MADPSRSFEEIRQQLKVRIERWADCMCPTFRQPPDDGESCLGCGWNADEHLLRDLLSLLSEGQTPQFAVIPLHDGEENDGALRETEIFVEGAGWSLTVDIPVKSRVTYCYAVNGQAKQSGGIHFPLPVVDPKE